MHITVMYRNKLYCNVLQCTIMYCTEMPCTVLYINILCWSVMQCTALDLNILHGNPLQCTEQYTKLEFSAQHCTALQCITPHQITANNKAPVY